MTTALRPRTLILFIGDICFFVFALWLSLFMRAFETPSRELFIAHLLPFTVLFVAWFFVFFIAGLYESRSIILERRRISATLLVSQITNIIIAALFFFFIPIFGIAPKTLLFIYLAVSFLLVLLWRVALFPLFAQKTEAALVVGEGKEIDELVAALSAAPHAPTRIAACIRPSQEPAVAEAIKKAVATHNPRFIIADFNNAAVVAAFPELYNYLAHGIRFIDAMSLYEEVFGRVPLSVIDDRWLARNVSLYSHTLYDVFKRVMDIVIALPAAIISLIFYPFIALAIKLQDGGPVVISMPRVGEDGQIISMHKFRSMTGNDSGNWGIEGTQLRVTPVGGFLRVTRLDELPQLWDVVAGTFSMIGPRPEFPNAVERYKREIPYYDVRHLIKPGLSGWAQLYGEHAHHGVDLDTTSNKLSYDLYYIKHRSLTLDITIALKTIKKLLTRSGV